MILILKFLSKEKRLWEYLTCLVLTKRKLLNLKKKTLRIREKFNALKIYVTKKMIILWN